LSQVNTLLYNAGISECNNGELIISRHLTSTTVRNFVNSTPVTLKILNQLGDVLVDIHGPYDQQSLLHTDRQLDLLDAFSGLENERNKFRESYRNLCACKKELGRFQETTVTPDHIDFVNFQLNKIRNSELRLEEDKELTERHKIVANSKEILSILDNCKMYLNGQAGGFEKLTAIARELRALAELSPTDGECLIQLIDGIIADVQSFDEELHNCGRDIEIDPSEFAALEERLSLVETLKRKYGGTIESVLEYANELEQELDNHKNIGAHRDRLMEQVRNCETDVEKKANALTRKRKNHAQKLAKQVTEKLQRLGFEHSSFDITLDSVKLNAIGSDTVEFYISLNPGEGSKPLRTIASSGEISRIMLAIKTTLAGVDHTPVLVFDEIDVNIGGNTATIVSRELQQLSSNHQVICITHLPQIAANADRHFLVEKSTSDSRTTATVSVMTTDQKVREIRRMLGGSDDAGVIFDHAAELVATEKSQ